MALRSSIIFAILSLAPTADARLDTPTTRSDPTVAPDQSRVREHAEQTAPETAIPLAPTPAPELPPSSPPPPFVEFAASAASAALEARPLGPAAAPAVESMRSTATGAGGWLRVTIALGAVVSLIFALRFVLKRAALRTGGLAAQLGAAGRAPSGVLEVLGRFPVARGQTLVLLRMDRRVLLISQTAAGMTTLAEVCDPEEIASLITRTRDDEGASAAARFNAILRNLERDPDTALALAPAPLREPERVAEEAPDADDPIAAIRRRLVGLKGAGA